MRRVIVLISVIFFFCSFSVAEKRALTFDDFIKIGRVSDPQISPDGKYLAYVVTYLSKEENTSNSEIWVLKEDGENVQITRNPRADFHPRWSPDGKELYFISVRDSGHQIYKIRLGGGEPIKITSAYFGISSFVLSPDGRKIVYVSKTYPDCKDDKCNKEREEAKEKEKLKVRIYKNLLFRHWNEWRDEKRNHIFLLNLEDGEIKDLIKGNYDAPPVALGGNPDYSFSPDGNELAFTMNTDPIVAISTNNDVFVHPLDKEEPVRISKGRGNDNQPVYSPDGKYIAFRSMERPGFEADRERLIIYDRETGKYIPLTEKLDLSIDEILWNKDSKAIYFTAENKGFKPLFKVGLNGKVEKILDKVTISQIRLSSEDKIFFVKQSINNPPEIFCFKLSNELSQLTHVNDSLLRDIQMNPVEEIWFKGSKGRMVHALMVKPPNFEENKKYPVVFLIHGGPQNAWLDAFHFRWNAQMFASPGYVVVMINFTGSTGYGQKFTDEISGDWGGAPFEDIMKGVEHVSKLPFIDKNRMAAAGASYGGYMINWIAGHTDVFKCLISHAGVYNLESMYGATEELWFPEWEFKGTPWTNRKLYEKFSPHRYAQNFKTPTLVSHGELDYRVPVTEGLQFYTTLQRKGVPSKLIYFPDEDHFISKPKNAEIWWKEVLSWLDKYLK
ncbi:MAG: prolyl oligopeptidase family serine peptidase [Candidatus Aminicenantia bacterium]